MAVGDDAQSIYAFRGADFRNIMDFPRLFPGAAVIALEQNYRSTQPILDATNAIIGQARERYTKTLFTTKAEGETPLLIAAYNENFQSRFIAQRILTARKECRSRARGALPLELNFPIRAELSPAASRSSSAEASQVHRDRARQDRLAHLRVLAIRRRVSWHRPVSRGIGRAPPRR